MLKSDCFCILPFIHQEIQQDGNVFACCRAQEYKPFGNTSTSSPEELWNCPDIKQMRLELTSNVWPRQCQLCKRSEEVGLPSMRQDYNHLFKESLALVEQMNEKTGELLEYNLKYIGIRHSNLCNFSCHYCDHNYSTRWAQINGVDFNVESFPGGIEELIAFTNSHLKSLEKIYIAGGEPLITPDHLKLLKFLENNKTDLWLIYNTNLSSLKIMGVDLIPIWNKFKKITISASIDDFGERFEFIRRGGKWKKVEENIKKVLSEKIELEFFITITNLNIFYLDEFLSYLVDVLYIKTSLISFNILENPSYYSVHNLSSKLQKEAISKINIFIKKRLGGEDSSSFQILLPKLQTITKYLSSCRSSEDFIQNMLKGDKSFSKKEFKRIFNQLI